LRFRGFLRFLGLQMVPVPNVRYEKVLVPNVLVPPCPPDLNF
jgi:hypothetical protein